VFRRHEPARLQLLKELRGYGLRRLLLHQFMIIAKRAATSAVAEVPTPVRGRGGHWRPNRPARQQPIGLAAAKHYQGVQIRAALLAEVQKASQFPPPVRGRPERIFENVPLKRRLGRGGPMSFYELIEWHRANGTLAAFMASLGPG